MSDTSKSFKKPLLWVAGICILTAAAYHITAGNYNKMIQLSEEIAGAQAQVENQYQRRMDLIPNLVNTVKAAALHEEEIFEQIARAASLAGSVRLDGASDSPEKLAEYEAAQKELGTSLNRLLAVCVNYPALKANENFLSLQDELAGTENRIAQERRVYNETVKEYNTLIKRFPSKIVADFNSFTEKPYLKAAENASSAPEIKF